MNTMSLSRLTSILALLLVGVSTAVAQLPPPPAEPIIVPRGLGEIRFIETLHEFGDIWDHEKVTHEFGFVNVGSETLNITDVRSTCGCTVPELAKKNYQPGESGVITVIFDPKNRGGAQRKTINVTTDSRKTPNVGLTIVSNVTKVLDIQPSIANMGRVFKNEDKGIKVSILGSMPGFKATPAEKQPAGSEMFVLEHVETGDVEIDGKMTPRTTLRVSINPGLPVGRHSGDLLVTTNDPRRPEVTLRATITIVGDLQARPPRFALGRLNPGAEFEATLVLVNRVADPFKITGIETGPDLKNIQITHKPVSEGQEDAYEITVRGIAPADQTRILGQIIVTTDLEAEKTMELPIYGFVSGVTPKAPEAAASSGSTTGG